MTIHICRSFRSHSLQKFPYPFKPKHVAFTLSIFFISSARPDPPRPINAVAEYLINKHHFSPVRASNISSAVSSLRNPDKSDLVLSFLKECGFSKPQIELITQRVPQILSSNLDRSIKPKFQMFEDFGFSPSDAVEIIASYPWILAGSVDNRLCPSILALKSVLGPHLDVCRVLKRNGLYLNQDLENNLIPNIDFLKSRGASSAQITAAIYSFPRFFSLKTKRLKEYAKRVDEMGFGRNSKMFIHAIRVYSSMSSKNWEHKLQIFRNLGFSDDDIMSMFRRMPHVFSMSEGKITEGTQLFLSAGKVDISCIADKPELLLYSIEKRLKPRFHVLEVLEKKGLLMKLPTISSMVKLTDDKFHRKFVIPFSKEVGELNMIYKGSKTK